MSRADLSKAPTQVAAMFDDVAERYDVTNDVLALGQTRVWRRAVVEAVAPRPGQLILDLAAGTGTSSRLRPKRRCARSTRLCDGQPLSVPLGLPVDADELGVLPRL